jgi:hypothetical protein
MLKLMALDVRKLSNEYVEYNYFLDLLMLHTGACFREAAAFLLNKGFNESINIYSIDSAFRLTKLEDKKFLEDMLEDLASFNYLDDDLPDVNRLPHRIIELDYEYFLKKNDILELPYIQELNIELLGEKYNNNIAEIYKNRRYDLFEYRRSGRIEEEDLRQQKTRLKQYKVKAKAEIAELKKQLKQADINIAQLTQQADAPADDKELLSNSQAGVARMLYAILTEHGYDLSPMKGKGVANDMIVSAANTHGTSVTRNFVADWLIRAREVKIHNIK